MLAMLRSPFAWPRLTIPLVSGPCTAISRDPTRHRSMQTRRGKVLEPLDPGTASDSGHQDSAASRVPAFLTKTYELASEESHAEIVSWAEDGLSFVIWQPAEFSRDLLPLYFKHSNLASFVRQLNTYGFQKSSPDRWEFSHPNFRCARPDLLTQVPRRRTPKGEHTSRATAERVDTGHLQHELDDLKRDRETIVKEVLNLRQQQAAQKQETAQLASRLDHTERLHQQLLVVLKSAAQDPAIQQALASRPSLQIASAPEQPGTKRRRAETQLVPFSSAASDLVAMLLAGAPGTRPVDPPTSSATSRGKTQPKEGSGEQAQEFSFMPVASSGGVEAMPAISPFTSASDLAFEQRAQVQDVASASGPSLKPVKEEERPVELSTQDLLVENPIIPAQSAGMWGMGPVRRSSEYRFDVLGSQPSWMMPGQQMDQEVH